MGGKIVFEIGDEYDGKFTGISCNSSGINYYDLAKEEIKEIENIGKYLKNIVTKPEKGLIKKITCTLNLK